MVKKEQVPRSGGILIYQAAGGQTKLEVRLEGQAFWPAGPVIFYER